MKKTFKIPVTWAVCGFVNVSAETIEDAIKDFKENIDEYELPDYSDYVDGSFTLSTDETKIIKMYQ